MIDPTTGSDLTAVDNAAVDNAAYEEEFGEEAARRRAASAICALGHLLVGRFASTSDIEAMATAVEKIGSSLHSAPARSRADTDFRADFVCPPDRAVIESLSSRPFSGPASPWSCGGEIRRIGREAVARVTFRPAHEGPPGRCHGGIVAGMIDNLMGMVLRIEALAAFTGELTVRYEAGVPLGCEIVMRARLAERDGRKLYITADAWDGDQRLVTAQAIFISYPAT